MDDKDAGKMFCKKCKEDITYHQGYVSLKYKSIVDTLPTDVLKLYEGFSYAPACSKCWTVIDYKELELGEFWEWLKHATEGIKDSKLKGKTIIRYFDLADLLQQNTK